MRSKKQENFYIYGRQPVAEFIEAQPENVKFIYVGDHVEKDIAGPLAQFAKKNDIPFNRIPRNKIEKLVGDVNDQGVIIEIKEFKSTNLEEWLAGLNEDDKSLVFVLDEVEDPRNVGAIARTAAAAGASGIILSKHRQAPITGTVFKTSAGAILKIPVIIISNTNDTMRKLKDAGFWIAGLDAGSQKTVWDEKFDTKTAIVIGNEGRGIRETTGKICDYMLSIPMEREVESLNAAVSAAIVAYEWKRKGIAKK